MSNKFVWGRPIKLTIEDHVHGDIDITSAIATDNQGGFSLTIDTNEIIKIVESEHLKSEEVRALEAKVKDLEYQVNLKDRALKIYVEGIDQGYTMSNQVAKYALDNKDW